MNVRRMHVVDTANPLAVRDAIAESLEGAGPPVLPRAGGGSGGDGRDGVDRTALALDETWPHDACLVIETSGSTAVPKRVVLTATALRASALATERRLTGVAAARAGAAPDRGAASPAQWLLCLPTEYVAGAQVLVRSILAGTEPVIAAPGSFDPVRFAHDTARMHAGPRRTSLVPAQLLRLIEAAEVGESGEAGEAPDVRQAVASFDAILVGGQATPPPVRARAEALGWNLVTTYGASETAGGCVYNGVPLDGVEAAVVDGEIRLRGDVLAAGYFGDPERTASTFVVDGDGARWYRTGDAGTVEIETASAEAQDRSHRRVRQHQRVRVTGRLDNVIISGGEKVLLDRVERIVRGIPGYEDAVVVGVPSERWGEMPAVVIAAGSTGVDDEATLAADPRWAALRDKTAEAGRAAKPSQRIRVAELPRLVSGKPDRRALTALAAELLARNP